MDSAYRNALKRKAELQEELLEIEAFLALYSRFSDTSIEQNETSNESRKSPGTGKSSSRKRRKKATPSEIGKVARAVIREAERPLTRSELVDKLEDRGLVLLSKDKPRYVGTILWRLQDDFVNLDGHGYWEKGADYAPAGYFPSHNSIDDIIESARQATDDPGYNVLRGMSRALNIRPDDGDDN
ncbi:MAG: hypothetical protein RIB57_07765 [Pelagibacterium sp.]|uniref:hypothetical protein n=1 Tax=Pelagibacterium sp. TaxID=1967288 RepID=UPI0032F0938D